VKIYKGFIEINDIKCPFIFTDSDFLLRIFQGDDSNFNGFNEEDIDSIVKNGMIRLLDSRCMELYAFIDYYESIGLGEIMFHVAAYLYKGKHKTDDFKIESLLFKNEIIDYLFEQRTETTLDKYIDLINTHKTLNNLSNRVVICEDFQIDINDKKYSIEFGTMSNFDIEIEKLSFSNYILVKNDEGISIEEIFAITEIVKAFLCFVSQSRNINLNSVCVKFQTRPEFVF